MKKSIKNVDILIDDDDEIKFCIQKWIIQTVNKNNKKKVNVICNTIDPRNGRRIKIYLHRYLLHLSEDDNDSIVSFKNGNRLDFTKSNLEVKKINRVVKKKPKSNTLKFDLDSLTTILVSKDLKDKNTIDNTNQLNDTKKLNDEIIEDTINYFIEDKKAFTSVDISNFIKTTNTWISNSDITKYLNKNYSEKFDLKRKSSRINSKGEYAFIYYNDNIDANSYTGYDQKCITPDEFNKSKGQDNGKISSHGN